MRVYIPKSQRANNGALAFRNYFYEPLLPFFQKNDFCRPVPNPKIIFLNESIFCLAPNSPHANASKIAQWLLK